MEQIIQNLDRLKNVRPDLAAQVITPLPPRVQIQSGKTNLPTLIYHSQQGEKLLHSRYDPLREAQRFAQTVTGDWDHLVVMGMGLGYLVLPLLEQKLAKQRILIYEPDPAIFSASLHVVDWGRLLASRDDLFVVIGTDDQQMANEVHRFFSLTVYEQLQTIFFPGEKSLFPEAFKRAETTIDSLIRTLFYDFKTRLAEGGMVSQNILHNLPHILKTRPLRLLSNLFSGQPGIIVSAGPSLDANIAHLYRVQDRALIIAVDTALKPLLARGIQPHFTVTADPSHKNYRHLLGTEGRIQHYLLAESAVSTRIFQDFTQQIFTVSIGKPLLSFCEHVTGPIGELDAWGSVVSLAFSFAIYLGLEPLTFIGQDFAYTHMRNHCRHSSWEESLLLESPSLERLQRFERQSITGQMVEKKDIFGRPVYSSDRLVLYKDYLARRLRSYPNKNITNSSEGGILSEVPFLPLGEFLRLYLAGKPRINFSSLTQIPALGNPRVTDELSRIFIAQTRYFKKYHNKLRLMINRLSDEKTIASPKLINEAEELKQALYHQEEHGNLVEMWSQFPIYTFLSSQKKLPANPNEPLYSKRSLDIYRKYFQSLYLQLSVMISAFKKVSASLGS